MAGVLLQRLVNKADFERLLSARSVQRSAHFAVHHVTGAPHAAVRMQAATGVAELSTDPLEQPVRAVDESLAMTEVGSIAVADNSLWLGCVVPKRLARRAVTRNLLKRQIRSAFQRQGGQLPSGLWLVRLRAPFPVGTFVSARSALLASAARDELDGLLLRACTRANKGAA